MQQISPLQRLAVNCDCINIAGERSHSRKAGWRRASGIEDKTSLFPRGSSWNTLYMQAVAFNVHGSDLSVFSVKLRQLNPTVMSRKVVLNPMDDIETAVEKGDFNWKWLDGKREAGVAGGQNAAGGAEELNAGMDGVDGVIGGRCGDEPRCWGLRPPRVSASSRRFTPWL